MPRIALPREDREKFRIRIPGARIPGVNLDGADLYEADLRGTNLTNASLRGADLLEAKLKGAILKGADLTAARNLTWEQISQAIIDDTTVLPEGLKQHAAE